MAEKKTGKTAAKTSKPVKTAKTAKTTKAAKPVRTTKTVRKTKAAKPARTTKTVVAAPESPLSIDIDAYSPPQIARRLDAVTGVKAKDSAINTFLLGINAGAFIALGAQFATLVISDSGLHAGLTAVVGAIVFCLGLIMVVVGGAELFTGNCMIFIGYMEKRITTKKIFDHWTISLIGNFVGSLLVVFCVYKAQQFSFYDYVVGGKALLIANKKVNLTFTNAFAKAVLCNAMVCMAVWVCFSARNVADKVMTLIFPIGGFVASGFEHLVANMYFIPMGIILKSKPEVVAAAEKMAGKTLDFSNLTWKGFFVINQFPVFIGNVVGGIVLAGLAFWFIYLRPKLNFSFTIKEDFKK
ncbi:MAG: formate/nitrite transporter family protein [Candidatus Scalindua sp.]|jgi:formate/nitrite transporter|nr:formate/nitrite transporter family protein [Candidatus Scalindua sp.]MDV5165850.1 formate/nitrite transporter family protein [Candidatus Scalindua sp.]